MCGWLAHSGYIELCVELLQLALPGGYFGQRRRLMVRKCDLLDVIL